MPIFTAWQASAEYAEAKKTVDGIAARIKTVKDDIARMTPKLSTYKKATLEKMIKEAEGKVEITSKGITTYHNTGPEAQYFRKLESIEADLTTRIKKTYQEQTNAIQTELKQCVTAANAFRANGDGKGGGTSSMTSHLWKEYKNLVELLKKELAAAAKENPPNPARKI
jgi:hypothetical protein